MFPTMAAAILAVAAASPAPPDSAHVVVRRFPVYEVTSDRLHDLRSSEQAHLLTPTTLRILPVQTLAQAVALQAGVVAIGEDLHVRGGRAGETQTVLQGLPLSEPLRGSSPELPLYAVRDASLLAGGLDADRAGTLAGVIDVRTVDPTPAWHANARWTSDGRKTQGLDTGDIGASGPLPLAGLGVALGAQARLDDQGLPDLRSRGREQVLGRSFGWRNDNHLSAWLKLAPIASPQAFAIEVLGSRVVSQPYDPMYAFDDSVRIYEPILPLLPKSNSVARADTTLPYDSLVVRYRAADHHVMSEQRRLGVIVSAGSGDAHGAWHASLGYLRDYELTSVGLRQDPEDPARLAPTQFGEPDHPGQNPFLAIWGDDPYFRRSLSQRWLGQVSASRELPHGHTLKAGFGLEQDDVELYEFDTVVPRPTELDTVRSYHARAPGAWAFVQHRWEGGGLVWNAGLRLQMFTAGPDAPGASAHWTLAPRFGFTYPASDRDAFSLAYVRVEQDPSRDVLYDDRILVLARRPLGDPTIGPAEMESWQVGLKHLIDARWALQLGVYYRDLFGLAGIRNEPYFANSFRLVSSDAAYGHAAGWEASLLGRFAGRGEASLRYTFLNAWGTQSNANGYGYGPPFGPLPLPIDEHPLDWDRRHVITLDAAWRASRRWTFAWVTHAASGLPWTPATSDAGQVDGPALTEDLSAVNSRRLPWGEHTDISVRLTPPRLARLTALFEIRNLFDSRSDQAVDVQGGANPIVNTLYDEYAGFRTATGQDGGGYWNDPNGDGHGRWIAVHDPRLAPLPRSLRFGVELAL